MTSPISSNDVFNANPYESHPSLTTIEAEVLWEYAKLAQHIKLVGSHRISNAHHVETPEIQGDAKDAFTE